MAEFWANAFTVTFVSLGSFFFLAGAVGVLRFPDVYTRLHALTKSDNLGLGFVVMGLLPQVADWVEAVQLLLIWLMALAASITASHLIGRAGLGEGVEVWRHRP